MIRNTLLVLFAIILISCQTVSYYTTTEYKTEIIEIVEEDETVSIPEVEISVYKVEVEGSEVIDDPPIPIAEKVEPELPIVTIVEDVPYQNPYIENPVENFVEPEIIPNNNNFRDNSPVIVPDNSTAIDETPLTFELYGDSFLSIPLLGSGWIFNGGQSEKGTMAVNEDRVYTGEKTIFTFSFPESGSYTLSFQRQDLDSGDVKRKLAYVEVVNDGSRIENEDIFQQTSNSDEYEQFTNEHGNPEDKLTNLSEDQINAILESAEENPDISYRDRIDILDYLVTYYGTGPRGAEYYYRLAQILEQQGRYQDIHQSYDLYNFVSDNFPLSMYSRLSRDRIRYLERHYFRIN